MKQTCYNSCLNIIEIKKEVRRETKHKNVAIKASKHFWKCNPAKSLDFI